MKKCFACLRRMRMWLPSKKQSQKWVTFFQHYCSQNSKFQWCDILLEHFIEIKQFTGPTEQVCRQLRSTNISSEIIKMIGKNFSHTPFTLMIEIFGTYVSQRYSNVVNPSQATLSKIVTDFNNFTEMMRSLIVIYYQLEERELIGDDQFFRVTLLNYISQCLFNHEQFSICVMQVVKNSSKEATDRIAFNMQRFHSFSIHEYEVDHKYTLDEKTLHLFGILETNESGKPYHGPIQMMKSISKAKTPLEKVKCLESIIQQVQFTLKKYYEDHQIEKQIILDADNAISILLYIIVQSEQGQLLSQINFIDQFVNKDGLSGSLGYCLVTIRACLQFLEKGSIKRSRGLNISESQFSLWINAHSYFEQIRKERK